MDGKAHVWKVLKSETHLCTGGTDDYPEEYCYVITAGDSISDIEDQMMKKYKGYPGTKVKIKIIKAEFLGYAYNNLE